MAPNAPRTASASTRSSRSHAEVRPVPRPGCGRLEARRVADLVRRGDRRVDVETLRAQQGHAVRGEQGQQLVVGDVPPRPARRRGPPHGSRPAASSTLGSSGASPTGRRRHWAYSLTFASEITARSGVDRTGTTTAGHAVVVQDRELRRDALGGQEAGHDQLGRTRGDVEQRGPELLRPRHQRREEDRDDGVHPVVVHRFLQRRAEVVGGARAPMSTGSSFASSSPWSRTASAARQPMAVELPTIATRLPSGSGWWARRVRRRTSRPPSRPGSRRGGEQRRDGLLGHRDDVSTRPRRIFTCAAALHGHHRLRPAELRASRANLRGLPKLSRCRSTTRWPGPWPSTGAGRCR